jgi:hypothetical protein
MIRAEDADEWGECARALTQDPETEELLVEPIRGNARPRTICLLQSSCSSSNPDERRCPW